ncbi:MAG: type II toxin-antitoxin system VapC family toxin [bacterium]|nr:type II toxin-antitoxin system VapC family toxin [bacterium]
MIVDTSAVVAIVAREPGYESLIGKLRAAEQLGIGTPTLTETAIVLEGRFGLDGRTVVERFLHDFEVIEVAYGDLHWREALAAYRRFGKGRHPAALNFGDCMSYATAKLASQPLLFVGDDFPKTDVRPA